MSVEPDLRLSAKNIRLYGRIYGDYMRGGYSKNEIARRWKIHRPVVDAAIAWYELYLRGEDPETKRRLEILDRNKKIWREWRKGKTTTSLAKRYRLPEQQIMEIVTTMELDTA